MNHTLTLLDLAYASLEVDAGIALGEALQKNRTLRALDLYHNVLDDEGAMAVWEGAEDHPSLLELNLSFNRLSMKMKSELKERDKTFGYGRRLPERRRLKLIVYGEEFLETSLLRHHIEDEEDHVRRLNAMRLQRAFKRYVPMKARKPTKSISNG